MYISDFCYNKHTSMFCQCLFTNSPSLHVACLVPVCTFVCLLHCWCLCSFICMSVWLCICLLSVSMHLFVCVLFLLKELVCLFVYNIFSFVCLCILSFVFLVCYVCSAFTSLPLDSPFCSDIHHAKLLYVSHSRQLIWQPK